MKEAGRNAPYYKEALSLYVDSKIDTKPKPWVVPQFNLEMLWCPPGSFVMGSPKHEEDRDEDEIQHNVTLTKGFWIGKYEVTQAQWQKLMGNNPSAFKDPKRPVERISWYDATEFCERLTEHERNAGRLPSGMIYKLPTEAQWEYACWAGTQTVFFFGDALSCSQANLDGDYPYGSASKISYLERTVPVGSYVANSWGIHDMHGNVWEWCSDWYGVYTPDPVTDPQGASIGLNRVYRGGSWGINGQYCRSAFRYWFAPDYKSNKLGFRVTLATAN
jgi:sulfatase modifying factor 1